MPELIADIAVSAPLKQLFSYRVPESLGETLQVGVRAIDALIPQERTGEEKQRSEKGDKIVTVGGIFGTVVGIKEKENVLIVKIAENTKIELVKTSVAKVIGREE